VLTLNPTHSVLHTKCVCNKCCVADGTRDRKSASAMHLWGRTAW